MIKRISFQTQFVGLVVCFGFAGRQTAHAQEMLTVPTAKVLAFENKSRKQKVDFLKSKKVLKLSPEDLLQITNENFDEKISIIDILESKDKIKVTQYVTAALLLAAHSDKVISKDKEKYYTKILEIAGAFNKSYIYPAEYNQLTSDRLSRNCDTLAQDPVLKEEACRWDTLDIQEKEDFLIKVFDDTNRVNHLKTKVTFKPESDDDFAETSWDGKVITFFEDSLRNASIEKVLEADAHEMDHADQMDNNIPELKQVDIISQIVCLASNYAEKENKDFANSLLPWMLYRLEPTEFSAYKNEKFKGQALARSVLGLAQNKIQTPGPGNAF